MIRGECQCPKIDLAEWNNREVSLADHCFLAAPTPLFFHLPHRLRPDLEALEGQVDGIRYRRSGMPFVLHRDGWFSGELLVSVDPLYARTPEVQNFQKLFYSRVVPGAGFDTALRQMPRFYSDLAAARVGRIEAMYFWYLSCPRCLLDRGAERVILLARSSRQFAPAPCPMPAGAGGRRFVVPCQV